MPHSFLLLPSRTLHKLRLPLPAPLLLLATMMTMALAIAGCTPSLGAATSGWGAVAAAPGVVYAAALNGQVYALDDFGAEGVSQRWVSAIGGEQGFIGAYNPPAVGRQQRLYIAGIDGFLYALEPPTGAGGGVAQILWRRPLIEQEDMPALIGSPALDENGGIVAVGSEDGRLYAYEALTGEPLPWSPFIPDAGGIWSTPVLRAGTAYFGTRDGAVYALNLATGVPRWTFQTGGAIVAKPLLHKDLLVIGSFDRRLYALDAGNGLERWQHQADNWWWATPASSGRVIYAPAMDGKVYALDENGTLLWTHDMGAPVVSSPVVAERGLVVAARDGRVSLLRTGGAGSGQGAAQQIAAYNLRDAEIKAPLTRLELAGSGANASAGGETEAVFIGSDDGKVRRMQLLSGFRVQWCYDTEAELECPRN